MASTQCLDCVPHQVAKRPKSGFYSVPLVKYCMRAVSHVLFLCLYFEVCTHLLTSLMTSDDIGLLLMTS
jgi:hypothetical protein